MKLSVQSARDQFTKAVVPKFRQNPQVLGFLASFFPAVQRNTLALSYNTTGVREYKAEDIERGAEGNRNKASTTTENVILPPYYNEYLDITKLHLYDKLYGAGTNDVEVGVVKDFLLSVTEELTELRKKIERAYEYQAAQVLTTGVVTTSKGGNFDFGRSGSSIVTAGTLWSVAATATPLDNLVTGANFLRTEGKVQGGIINVIMGGPALSAFLNTTQVKSIADIRKFDNIVVRPEQQNSVGAVFQGEVRYGSYMFRVWTYPEFYETSGNVMTPYIADNKVILIPERPAFQLMHAAVPQLLTNGQVASADQYVLSDWIDQRKKTHEWQIESTGLCVPKAKDQIYTLTVLS
jgi:hypothetical protein